MPRLVATASIVIATLAVANARADNHHKEWYDFFQGEWTYDWRAEEGFYSEKGEIRYNLVAKSNAAIGRIRTEHGDREIEIWGWQPDSRKLTLTGYSSNGSYWVANYTDVESDRMSGSGHGVLPNGARYEGKLTLTKKERDFEIRFNGTSEGTHVISVGKFTRKNTGLPNEARNVLASLAGEWVGEGNWQGTEYEALFSGRLVHDGAGILVEAKGRVGAERFFLSGVYGWDAANKSFFKFS